MEAQTPPFEYLLPYLEKLLIKEEANGCPHAAQALRHLKYHAKEADVYWLGRQQKVQGIKQAKLRKWELENFNVMEWDASRYSDSDTIQGLSALSEIVKVDPETLINNFNHAKRGIISVPHIKPKSKLDRRTTMAAIRLSRFPYIDEVIDAGQARIIDICNGMYR